ncbi:MAG: hypothetical protein GDA46_05240 [Bdellovibrionales bacterium]|nr:hypothetical protein [Bdellovibrionales bacterium]
MKQLVFLFIAFNILSCNKSKESDSNESDYKQLNCDWREHPTKESPIVADQNSVYNINQVLSLSLNSSEPLVPVVWSKEELDKYGYTGTNKAFVKVNVEKDGDYIKQKSYSWKGLCTVLFRRKSVFNSCLLSLKKGCK